MADTNIYAKLRKVQLELKVPKSQRNSFGNYNYRSAEDILEAVKPVLDKQGLTLIVSDRLVNIGDRYYVEATASVNGETEVVSALGYAREDADKKGMDGSQITGAASSYARKYALNGLFAIDDTKDADRDEHGLQMQQPASSNPSPSRGLVKATKPAVGSAKPSESGARKVTEAQAKLLFARARDASGFSDAVEVNDFFVSEFDMLPAEVPMDQVDRILQELSK